MIDVNFIGAPAFSVQVVAGGDFVYTGVNRRLTELTGLRDTDLVGHSPRDCMPADVSEGIIERYRQCVATRQAIDAEAFYDLPGGGRWWHVTVTPVLDADGEVTSLVGVSADITDRKTVERQRREFDARMALALDVLDGGFWHFDVASHTLEVSPKLAAMVTGRDTASLGWDEYASFVHPDDLRNIDVSALSRGEIDGNTAEYRILRGGHETRWLRCKRRLIRDDAEAPVRIIGVVIDVTEQRSVQDLYENQATTDPLTGLKNRRGFDAGASRFLQGFARKGTRFGLIVMDLDRFKPVNDRYGHAIGDLVLRELAARLRRQVRANDVVARLGGDEFAILVEDCEDDELPHLAQRLVLAARQPVGTPFGELQVGMSVGITLSVGGDRVIGDLADRADRALYDAKRAGRGIWKLAA